ncbi:RNA polymerase subunit sigma-24 [Bacillus cereus]|uniref:sigma-70 family RNA polymerase sigma factor n=1 Tax=Bacillus sp. AFS023182 TaxID=2033492 RepID=UPI000BF30777|nr:sigma-70 family RNA polymerase sigma factor [Bacillus sp. AFS023182]PFE05060.1 RNA polymerase subunit sigma-24 [Bacillus sp. AFS023182]PGY02984.1 RNA polymerase subunit sigma-24 [Bacillus cereus]
MKELIDQYNKTLRQLEKVKETAIEADLKVLEGMISDVRYALEWMRTAKKPESKRGIERRSAYQREKLVNPLLMQRYLRSTETQYEWDCEGKENVISHWERIKLEDALSALTEHEKEIFIMYKGGMLTQEEISKELKVTRSTIQQILRRADKKIAKQLSESLFCIN